MANDLNQCTFIGRLGADPETRYSAAGQCIANFRIAVGHKYGEQEHTEWVRVVAFGKLGEIVDQYMKKGRQVCVSGRMQTREWEDQSGTKRYSTEIIANQVQMIGPRDDDAGGEARQTGGFRDPERKATTSQKAAPGPQQAVMGAGFEEDDIPF